MISLEEIKRKTAAFYDLDVAEMASSQRSRGAKRARQVAMYLARNLTEHSLSEIGRHFGGRNQTTVLHACRRVEALCARKPKFK